MDNHMTGVLDTQGVGPKKCVSTSDSNSIGYIHWDVCSLLKPT